MHYVLTLYLMFPNVTGNVLPIKSQPVLSLAECQSLGYAGAAAEAKFTCDIADEATKGNTP